MHELLVPTPDAYARMMGRIVDTAYDSLHDGTRIQIPSVGSSRCSCVCICKCSCTQCECYCDYNGYQRERCVADSLTASTV